MRFAPVSEEQAAGVWPKGEYDALVTEAVEKTSKKDNPMIELTLTVYGPEGKEKSIRDWLVATDGGQAKIQRFCKSAGIWDLYQAGEISAESCKDANVVVKLGADDGDDEYPPRNNIRDYMPKSLAPKGVTQKATGELAGVSPSQRSNAGTGRADPAKPPTTDDIPF
jgi:hypothetical protein